MIEYAEFKENMKNHKKLWFIISELSETNYEVVEDLGLLKENVMRTYGMEIPIRGLCYLCNIDEYNKSCDEDLCLNCPYTVNKPGRIEKCLDGRYEIALWLFKHKHYEVFRKLAREIAELPIVNPIYAEYAARMEHENELD